MIERGFTGQASQLQVVDSQLAAGVSSPDEEFTRLRARRAMATTGGDTGDGDAGDGRGGRGGVGVESGARMGRFPAEGGSRGAEGDHFALRALRAQAPDAHVIDRAGLVVLIVLGDGGWRRRGSGGGRGGRGGDAGLKEVGRGEGGRGWERYLLTGRGAEKGLHGSSMERLN